jgi:hypothetical protein
MNTTGEPLYDLIAAVVRRTILDATHRNDSSAIEFLDACIPDWRKRRKQGKRKGVAQHGMGEQRKPAVLLPETQSRW